MRLGGLVNYCQTALPAYQYFIPDEPFFYFTRKVAVKLAD
ncbi:MAG: hypothetical protein JWQ14_3035 [Adhaeribacter sp.]|jgi:hypothetical protein|nr:hypothetical protein [Adhaeribacter sp.]